MTNKDWQHQNRKNLRGGIEYTEVLYADDTLIFGNYTINLLLKEIQLESKYYIWNWT